MPARPKASRDVSDDSLGDAVDRLFGADVVPAPPPPAGAAAAAASRGSADPVAALFGETAPSKAQPMAGLSRRQISVDLEPVASLFNADSALPAPSIPPMPSEAELGRWHATTRISLFDDLVKDPPPPSAAIPADARVPQDDSLDDDGSEPEPDDVSVALPPPPAAALGKRKNNGQDAAANAAEPKARRARRRGLESSRQALQLGGLALLSLATLATLGVMLGVVPNPLAPSPTPSASPVPRATRTAVRPGASAAAPVAKASIPVAASAPKVETPPAPKVETAPAAKVEAAPAAKVEPAPVAAKVEPAPEAAASAAEAEESDPGAEKLIASARRKLAEDEPQAAEAILRQVLAADPRDHHAMELLAHALMDQDRGAEALPYARKIVARRPRRVPYRLLLGDLLLMTGDEAGAKREWHKALEITPGDPQINRRLGL
jgi:tetratricopeptide (TPR) repeat protein